VVSPAWHSTTISVRSALSRCSRATMVTMRYNIDLEVNVGDDEQHVVDFHWDQTWGKVRVCVDGVEVLKDRVLGGIKTTRRWELSVGESEVHDVLIEKRAPRFFGGLQRQEVKVFVDGDLVSES